MELHEIFKEVEYLYSAFAMGHKENTKRGRARARKALGGIKKLVTEYRRSSVEMDKQ